MEIKQGYYIKQHIENMNIDKYLLVLEVDNKHIRTIKHSGTPMDSIILDYQNLSSDGYTIDVISNNDVTCTTKYDTYLKNGIPVSYPMAVCYQWSNKELIIPLNQRYWNGSNWADIPEGFYDES